MRRNSLAIAITLVFAQPAFSADPAAAAQPRRMQSVVVVASRVEQPVGEIAGSVALIERERIETRLIRDIRDLARYDASLSVNEDASRFGAQGFAIRGLEGNRVAVELDGVPLGDGFSVGSFSRAGRNLVDPELLERVEFLRGPASSLYGSDALAGVVAMRTRDPGDLLAEGNGDVFVGSRITHDSRDASTAVTASTATVLGGWQMLLSANQRQEHERGNLPRSGGLQSNPAEGDERFVLAKLIHDDIVPGRLSFGFDGYRAEVETDVRSWSMAPASTRAPPRCGPTTARRAAARRWPGAASPTARVRSLEPDELRAALRDRAGHAAGPPRRDADAPPPRGACASSAFDTQQVGLEGLVAGEAQAGALAHRYVLGFDFARTALEESRNGSETNLATGVSSPVILGERLPVRDFPNSTVQELGVYAQDEIGFGERWFLIPALRLDRYRTDADRRRDVAGRQPGHCGGGQHRTQRHAEARPALCRERVARPVRAIRARLPCAAVFRRQHRPEHPRLRLQRHSEPGPAPRAQPRLRGRRALVGRAGERRDRVVRQPLSRSDRVAGQPRPRSAESACWCSSRRTAIARASMASSSSGDASLAALGLDAYSTTCRQAGRRARTHSATCL